MFFIGIITGIIITSLMLITRIISLQEDLYKEIKHSIKLENRIEELTNDKNN